jgi:hypothetical protein
VALRRRLQFFGHALWQAAAATGADLLRRVKINLRLPREAARICCVERRAVTG